MTAGSHWSEQEDTLLRECAAAGLSSTQTAARFSERYGQGRTQKSVKGRARSLGVKFFRFAAWTKADDEAICRLAADRATADQASKAIGKTRGAVLGRAWRTGVHFLKGNAFQRTRKQQRATQDWGIRQRLMDKAERKTAPEPQKPLPPPREAFSDRAPLNLTLLELTDATCKWPHGEEPPFLFCGGETFGNPPYCPFHNRRSHARPA